MSKDFDIVVVGAGPAGANAALAAARSGCRVALLDEQTTPGGQVWRAKSAAIKFAPATPETKAGDALRRAICDSDVAHISGARVWQIAPDNPGWQLHFERGNRSEIKRCKSLVLALGARDFVQPVPGWTTPGVVGLAGATAMLKQSLTPPGQHTVVSGSGPLVFFVASEIRRLGGKVAAIVTPNSRAEWARALPRMINRPGYLGRGAVWMTDLMLARVPIYWRHAVAQVHGKRQIRSVSIVPLDQSWTPSGAEITVNADSLCLGNGLVANIDAPRMLGVGVLHRPDLGGWVPETGDCGETTVPGLYLCGDGVGVRGADAAVYHGTLVGNRAAADLGKSIAYDKGAYHSAWVRAASFGIAMTRLSIPRLGLLALATADTVVCRCENVTRATLEQEIATGATSVNAIKSGSRAGMGPCGGKFCGHAIAQLIAAQKGTAIADIALPTPRPPLMPVHLDLIAGEFDYDDLPIPKPAPL